MFYQGLNPESSAIYDKTNQEIERFSEIIYSITVKATPALTVFPKFIPCLIVYFTSNMDNDALELPLLMWYVYIDS